MQPLILATSALITVSHALPQSQFSAFEDFAQANHLTAENNPNDQQCAWISGDFGQLQTCPPAYGVVGLCASGGNYDCGKSPEAWRINCCYLGGQVVNTCQVAHSSNWGEEVRCYEGYAMAGACTSGRINDCSIKTYSHTMVCCEFTDVKIQTDQANFQVSAANWGSDIECPSGYLVDGFCSSGRTKDCKANDGTKVSHYINCRPYTDDN